MYREAEKRIPLKKALGYVLASVVVIWGTLFLTWLLHKAILVRRSDDPRYNIVAIVQTGPQKESLQNWQLAELLELSRDKPQNLYLFDPKEATARLAGMPFFKRVQVRRQPPGIVHVDYQLREPVALIADWSNLAVDSEGCTFPLRPYYSPKNLPSISLGTNDLTCPEAILAFKLLDAAKAQLTAKICQIDTRSAYKNSAGLQEVVLVLEEGPRTRYLRMRPQGYEESLQAYCRLASTFDTINPTSPTQIIDLRTPSIALVK